MKKVTRYARKGMSITEVSRVEAAPWEGYFFFLALPATDKAIATACFWGLPAAISVLMFWDTVFRDLPFLSGIMTSCYHAITWPGGLAGKALLVKEPVFFVHRHITYTIPGYTIAQIPSRLPGR